MTDGGRKRLRERAERAVAEHGTVIAVLCEDLVALLDHASWDVDDLTYSNRANGACGRRFGIHSMREFDETRLETLAHNLAIGAALCRAFRVGFDEGWSVTGEGFNAEYCRLTADGYERIATIGSHNEGSPEWRPGCGKQAP